MTMPQEVETLLREALAEQAASLQTQIRTTHQLRVLAARFPAERRRSRVRGAVVAISAVAAAAAAVVALVQLARPRISRTGSYQPDGSICPGPRR